MEASGRYERRQTPAPANEGDIKKAGNRKRRQHLKRDLAENPEETVRVDFDFGRTASSPLNGNDKDSTRRRTEDEEE